MSFWSLHWPQPLFVPKLGRGSTSGGGSSYSLTAGRSRDGVAGLSHLSCALAREDALQAVEVDDDSDGEVSDADGETLQHDDHRGGSSEGVAERDADGEDDSHSVDRPEKKLDDAHVTKKIVARV